MAGRMSPKPRWIANCLALTEDDSPDRVRIWTTIPVTVFQEIKEIYLMEDQDGTPTYGEIQDYEEGRILFVKRTGTGMTNTTYNVQAHPKLYPVDEKKYSEEVHNLFEYAKNVLSQPIEMLADAVEGEVPPSERSSDLITTEKEIEKETKMIEELSKEETDKEIPVDDEDDTDESLERLKALLAEVDEEQEENGRRKEKRNF